jgi:hypothetical protein
MTAGTPGRDSGVAWEVWGPAVGALSARSSQALELFAQVLARGHHQDRTPSEQAQAEPAPGAGPESPLAQP